MLSLARIGEVYQMGIGQSLFESRTVLLANIPPEIRGGIPIHASPAQQMRQDLHVLNGRDSADLDPLPLVSWLRAAKLLLAAFPDQVTRLDQWIEECQALVGSRNITATGITPDAHLPRVLVARSGDDVLHQRQVLARRLQSVGIPLVLATYADDPDLYLDQFGKALPNADVVILPLGVLPARTATGTDLIAAQIAAATEKSKTLVQWRDVALLREDIDDPAHRTQVFADTVMATGFEDFKDWAVKRFGTYTPAPPDGIIFIDAGLEDEVKARQVFNECRRKGQAVVLRSLRPEDLSDWKTFYRSAGRVAIIQENSDTPSLESKLRRYMKEVGKNRTQDRCIIFRAPAPPRSEDELSVYHWDFHYIYSKDGDLALLGPFLYES